jgi:hypothetical protein
MARRKPHYPNNGWGREAFEEDIEPHVRSHVGSSGPFAYCRAYNEAKERLRKGEVADAIRAAIDTAPKLRGPRDDGRLLYGDEVHNRAEPQLARLRQRGVEDALAGRPSAYVDR